jgi:hypothetical protein
MAPQDSVIDDAAQAVADARTRSDRAGEARALSGLGQALVNAHRVAEGHYICWQAVQLAEELGDREAQGQALTPLGLSLEELDDWTSRDGSWREFLLGSSVETEWFASRTGARSDEFYASGSYRSAYRTTELFVELAVGFVVVKFLGPFAEAFATKLGERLGESAARAIGRLRLLWNHADDRRDLDVVLPEGARATLVLPHEFTDAARLAVIELDVTRVGGAELHWDPDTGQWRCVS